MSADPRDPIRVLIVTDAYPPECGGSGWSTHALALTLREAGHPVEVLEIDTATDGEAIRVHEGVEVIRHGIAAASNSVVRHLVRRDFSFAPVRRRVAALLGERPEIDIVHGQHLHSGPGALAAARQAGRGAVLTLRDHWPVCLHGTTWWGGASCPGCTRSNLVGCMGEHLGLSTAVAGIAVPAARRRMRARRRGATVAHRVVAVSDALRGRIAARAEGLLGPDDVEVVPNIVSPERSRSAAERAPAPEGLPDPYLFTAGKLNPGKGFRTLIDDLAMCTAPVPPLVVAGSVPLRDELADRAKEVGVAVRLLGWIDSDPLLRLMAEARAVLLPSLLEEALSRVMLEGMSLGAAVLARATGSSREVIDSGTNGWLVERTTDLDAALVALRDAARRARVGAAAVETVERRFAPAAVYPKILQVYLDAAREAGRDVA